ncbi:MAG TPA: hypothetical protein DD637_06455 [Verrucomicrobia bacterium]|nr:hypothetical protein [Verrucomicrobiota bacterium]HCG19886.1 hypothetical protein [Verrucomicrobiota bacterium]
MFALWRKIANVGVRHGVWGERAAACALRHKGYAILARNIRPVERDKRLEIDIVAYEPRCRTVVFVEVKQHARPKEGQSRLRSVDARKCRLLRRACRAWLRLNRWQGAYRFDVMEVYGRPDSGVPPRIDHIERVRLFASRETFVDWAD